MEQQRAEDWAGTERLRFYYYLRRRYQVGTDDRPLTVDEVTQLTRELEKLGGRSRLSAEEAGRVAEVRKELHIEGTT